MHERTRLILSHTFRFRRAVDVSDPCVRHPCRTCFDVHRHKLEHFLREDIPIQFVILAFPAKSPNPRKVLGPLPDLGELLSIEFLQSFCEEISRLHPPGARIVVASDGHVFGDLVGVSDEQVTAYRTELAAMIEQSGARNLALYALDDAFPPDDRPADLPDRMPDRVPDRMPDHSALRERLVSGYALPLEEIRRLVRTDADRRALFNGLHRFVFEDRTGMAHGMSRNQLRQHCKQVAYSVMQRSDAWSSLVAERFPAALRLSIHPQRCHSRKIGFQLLQTAENWFTPWHAVPLDDGSMVRLVRKSTAERLSATLVWRQQRPSHFVAPGRTTPPPASPKERT